MSRLRMHKAVFDSMRFHGEQVYPKECCGVLLGQRTDDGRRVMKSVRVTNTRTDSPHNRYAISPAELIKIEKDASRKGLEIVGFYHSHPNHPAQWSSIDYAEAHWIGCSYIITSILEGQATVTNSFLLAGTTEENKRFEPEEILLMPD